MTATNVGTAEWLARARSLAPLVEAHREQGDRERKLSAPVLNAAKDAGFLRMLAARNLGGEELSLRDALPVFEEMARQDGATGWTLMFAAVSPVFGDYLPERVAQDVFGRTGSVAASSFTPKGVMSSADGGYRLTGRWPFMSGCLNSEWFVLGGVVQDEGQPRLGQDNQPVALVGVVPASECEVIDTWYTGGMRATGSHDVEAKDIFVPADYTFPFRDLMRGPSPRPGLGYKRAFLELAPAFLATIALGIGQASVETLHALAQVKTALQTSSTLANQPLVHDKVGRALALLGSARAYLYEAMDAVVSRPDDGPPLTTPVRLAAAHAANSAAQAVGLMYEAGGGTSIYSSSRLDACFRDVNTVTHHFQVAPVSYAIAGEEFLKR